MMVENCNAKFRLTHKPTALEIFKGLVTQRLSSEVT